MAILMERTDIVAIRGTRTELTQSAVTNLRPREERERVKTNRT